MKTKQIDDNCTVGEKTIINEKTSVKNSFIGSNCNIENKVRLTNCILMNNVTIKERYVYMIELNKNNHRYVFIYSNITKRLLLKQLLIDIKCLNKIRMKISKPCTINNDSQRF